MTFTGGKQYQDIIVVNINKRKPPAPERRRNPLMLILASVLITVLLIAVGYLAGVKTGVVSPPDDICCFGSFDFDFDL